MMLSRQGLVLERKRRLKEEGKIEEKSITIDSRPTGIERCSARKGSKTD